jgi:hypothetical protein
MGRCGGEVAGISHPEKAKPCEGKQGNFSTLSSGYLIQGISRSRFVGGKY